MFTVVQVCNRSQQTLTGYIPKGQNYLTMSSSCPNNELYPHIATTLLLHSALSVSHKLSLIGGDVLGVFTIGDGQNGRYTLPFRLTP